MVSPFPFSAGGLSTHLSNDPSFERRSRAQDNSQDVLSATAELIDLINRGLLPPLPLSKFDGSLKEYPMFRASFMARVHNKCVDDGMRLAFFEVFQASARQRNARIAVY